jgi:hypothetical protein
MEIQHFLYQIFINVISSQLYIVFIQLDNFVQSQKWKRFAQKWQIPTQKAENFFYVLRRRRLIDNKKTWLLGARIDIHDPPSSQKAFNIKQLSIIHESK